jgi:hypothetical protein
MTEGVQSLTSLGEMALGAPAEAAERRRAKPAQGGLSSASSAVREGHSAPPRVRETEIYWLGRGAEGAAPVRSATSQ